MEPVYLRKTDFRDRVGDLPELYGTERLEHKETIWEFPDRLVFNNDHYIRGTNRKVNKVYYRWQNLSSYSLYKRNDRVYGKLSHLKKGKRIFFTDSNLQFAGDYFGSGLPRDIRDKFFNGEYSLEKLFPMQEHFQSIQSFYDIPNDLAGYFQAKTPREFVEKMFGKTRFRKSLLKAVSETNNIRYLQIAIAFNGLVPIDWVIDFLRNCDNEHRVYMAEFKIRDLRARLKTLDPRSYRFLLKDNDVHYVPDLTRPNRGLMENTPRFKSWREWHNAAYPVVVGRWRNGANEDLGPVYAHQFNGGGFPQGELAPPIRYKPEPPKIEDIAENKYLKHLTKTEHVYTYVHPATTAILADWSDYMHNCISGYGHQAVRGATILGAAMKDDKIIANFEISPGGKLKQLLGKYNQKLEAGEHEAIVCDLTEAGVDCTGSYWGRLQELTWEFNNNNLNFNYMANMRYNEVVALDYLRYERRADFLRNIHIA